jgi:hypothetical protein
MTPQQIRQKVLARIKELGTTVNEIKVGRFDNPFPVGIKSVYLASKGKASKRANLHLDNYFFRIEHQSKPDKIDEMVALLHHAKYGVHTDSALKAIVEDFLNN